LLVALPQSPETRRPDRHPQVAYAARNRVLARLAGQGALPPADARAALREQIPTARAPMPRFAPHLADATVAAAPTLGWHSLTIDSAVQASLENLAAATLRDQGARMQIAIMVADHTTGEVIASVGSGGYDADLRQGFVDMTRAVRSPGSTLKPLVYGLAFDQGMAHPETLIADRPMDFDGYAPQNFDGVFRGDIRVREALQQSLNLPVVSLTDAMGPQHLIAGLRRAGVEPQVPGGVPGLAVALGGLGVTLHDLVQLYAGLAQGGQRVTLRTQGDGDTDMPARIIGPVAAWQVADILRGVPRPRGVRAPEIAFKTGTSYGYRDAWSFGFDGRYVIGVWMGRADGTPVPGAFGGQLAAPVMFAAFNRVTDRITPLAPPPPATLIVGTAQLPQPLQRFRPRGQIIAAQDDPGIAFPPDGAVLQGDLLIARVRDGAAPFTWMANGAPVATSRRREVELPPLGIGFSTLTVIDAKGRSARAAVEVR